MKLRPARRLMVALLTTLVGFLWLAAAAAQEGIRVTVNAVDTTSFPQVTAFLTVTDANGLSLQGLGADAFTLSEDGRPIDDFTLAELRSSTEPISVVLALDTSGSMLSGFPTNALENTQRAAGAFVEALGPDDQVGLVAFSDEAAVIVPLTTDKAAVIQAIDDLEAVGNTALHDAIVVSVGLLKDLPTGRRAIILLSDGRDTSSSFSFGEAINEVTRWSIPTYPIGFGDVDPATMNRIGSLTGGYAQNRPDSTELEQAFESVRETLRHQYRLDFASGMLADGQEHSLLVALAVQGGQVTGTHTFIAQPNAVLVTLLDVADGQEVGGDFRLVPEIVAPAPVASVEYFLNGSSVASVAAAPFALEWDTTAVEPGTYELRAVATDTAGNSGEAAVQLAIRQPVIVRWLQPVDGQEVSGSQMLEVSVEPLSGVGVARVEFYLGDLLLDTLVSPPYQIQWATSEVEPGPATLRVRAVDTNNRSAEDEISVTVLLQRSSLVLWLALAVLAVTALIAIPVALRRRRKLQAAVARPAGAAAGAAAGMAAAARFVLRELEGRQPGYQWPLGPADLRIGRKADDNDIPAKGLSASRQHAMIHYQDGQYLLINLNKDNFTLVNGQPVYGEHALRPGDLITIGESVFRFEMGQ